MKWVKVSQKTTRKKGKEMKGKRFIETMEKKILPSYPIWHKILKSILNWIQNLLD